MARKKKNTPPALPRARDLIAKVTAVGFQWPNLDGPLAKIAEELDELKKEIPAWQKKKTKETTARLRSELGDLLFTVCNVAFLLGDQDLNKALHQMLDRFERRFKLVEKGVAAAGKKMTDLSLRELDVYWERAKKKEKKQK